jgi:hypothetical protein
MLKVVLATAATIAMIGAASAADLPRPQPVSAVAPVGKMPIGKLPIIGKLPVIGKLPIIGKAPGKGPVVAKY